MNIPKSVTLKEFFVTYLKCFNPVLKLKSREIQVLGIILKYYYENRALPVEELYALLYSKEMRKRMRDEIDMSEPSFNNHLVQLKAKRCIEDKNMQINKIILSNLKDIKETKKLDITYSINVVE